MNTKWLAVTALAALTMTSAAYAVDAKGSGTFSWLAMGSTYPMEANHFYFVGAFSGPTVMDDATHPANNTSWQCPGFNELGVHAAGYCIVTGADGDKLFLSWSCDHSEVPAGAIDACKGTSKVTGGTGKFEKATGSNSFASVIIGLNPDGSSAGYTKLSDFAVSY